MKQFIRGMGAISTWSALALAVPILAGCDAKEVSQVMNQVNKALETKSPYPVRTSDLMFGRTMSFEPVYWLDKDRALFPAYAPQTVKGPDGREAVGRTSLGIYIWDVKQNTYARYADMTALPRLFQYDHGNIAYMIENTDPVHGIFTAMVGKFGEEERMTLKGPFQLVPQLEPSRGPGKRVRIEAGVTTRLYTLLTTDAYIRASGDPDDRVRLYRPGEAEPVVLPILIKEMGYSAKFTYSDYVGKYVLLPHTWRGHIPGDPNVSWPLNQPIPIYLIAPDGQVEVIEIPPGTWFPSAVFPTREGLFWVSNKAPTGSSSQAGGWLLRTGKAVKLFDHLVDGAGVSPDGCTIVYASNDFNPQTGDFVQAISLCALQVQKQGEQ